MMSCVWNLQGTNMSFNFTTKSLCTYLIWYPTFCRELSRNFAAGNLIKCMPLVSLDIKPCNNNKIIILPFTEVELYSSATSETNLVKNLSNNAMSPCIYNDALYSQEQDSAFYFALFAIIYRKIQSSQVFPARIRYSYNAGRSCLPAHTFFVDYHPHF